MSRQLSVHPPKYLPVQQFQFLLYTVRDGVAVVTLNRPARLNALGMGPGSNREELLAALALADADPAVGAILLGAAGRAFCAGGDLGGATRRETVLDDHFFLEAAERFHACLRRVHKPVIAAVHGSCLGAGLALIAACDLVIAADDAVFGLVEGRIGLSGAATVVHLVGAAWAKFLIWTGETIDAWCAERIGLVLSVVSRAVLEDRSFELARRIGAMPREAVLLNKAAVDAQVEAGGRAGARAAGLPLDTATTAMARTARAPDGRLFREILRDEGMEGLKQARAQQYRDAWLVPSLKSFAGPPQERLHPRWGPGEARAGGTNPPLPSLSDKHPP